MNDDEQELATIQTYDAHAAEWIKGHADRSVYKALVARFQDFVPRGSVLEIGAGGGDDGAVLADAGYEYVGTDASAEMVRVAQAAHPTLRFEQCSVYDLAKLNRQFDGFWACAVLLHVPKRRIDEALQAIAGVVKPNGVGFITMKDGDHEDFEQREKLGRQEKRLFAYCGKAEFEQALDRNGFKAVDYEFAPESERTKWHRFFVRKERAL